MTRFFRAKSDVATSSLNKSATASIGHREQGFPAAQRGDGSIIGGDLTVDSVTLSQDSATLLQGGTLQLSATAFEDNGDRLDGVAFTWASDDETVATVSATGLVAVVGAGTCNIKATASAVDSEDCAITVDAILTTLTLSPTSRTFAHTTTSTTTCTGADQFGNAMTLPGDTTPHSSDTGKATVTIVTATGVITITGVAAGATNVTATEGTVTSNTCAVTCT